MPEVQYKMSFTTGGLFYSESLVLLEEYQRTRNWQAVQAVAIQENLLQSRTKNSAKRRVGEILARLSLLTDEQLSLLGSGSAAEQRYLLWIAVCKRFAFIHDFAVEVLREKFFRMDLLLSIEEYSYFFDSKAEWHAELEKLKTSTRKRMQQVLFQIMREAEIISAANMIIPALPTIELIRVIAQENLNWLRVLPVSETDIQRCQG